MVAVAGAGTGEHGWQTWGGLDDLRPAQWGPAGRIVVLAPHAGDEVLGLGGTMQLLAAAGHQLEVVIMATDTSASTEPVLDLLGVEPVTVTTIPLPPDAVERGADRLHGMSGLDGLDTVVGRLADHLAGAAWCITTWRGEGEPGHVLAGQVAAKAASSAGVSLAEYLVDTWTWAAPGDGRIPWDRARRSAFDRRLLARKEAAIARYRANHPVNQQPHGRLSPEARASLLRSFEVVLLPSAPELPPPEH